MDVSRVPMFESSCPDWSRTSRGFGAGEPRSRPRGDAIRWNTAVAMFLVTLRRSGPKYDWHFGTYQPFAHEEKAAGWTTASGVVDD